MSVYLNSLRAIVIGTEIGFTEEITDYTAIIGALIGWSMSVIVTSNMSTIWSTIVSNSALLLASDVIGIQRALVLSWFLEYVFERQKNTELSVFGNVNRMRYVSSSQKKTRVLSVPFFSR